MASWKVETFKPSNLQTFKRSDEAPVQTTMTQAEVHTHVPTTVIEPSRGWLSLNLRELWQYRELLYFLTWRDVKVRYKQTVLGAAWAILQPFFTMVVFSLFFGRLAGGGTVHDVLEAYPELEEEDVRQAMGYPTWVVSDQIIPNPF